MVELVDVHSKRSVFFFDYKKVFFILTVWDFIDRLNGAKCPVFTL